MQIIQSVKNNNNSKVRGSAGMYCGIACLGAICGMCCGVVD